MLRILAVVLLPFLMFVSLFAAPCQAPPATATHNCTAAAPCSVSVKWFKDNQHCMEPAGHHSDIRVIGIGGELNVTADPSIGNFVVKDFKTHHMPAGGPCDWENDIGTSQPFNDNHAGVFAPSHVLTAKSHVDGCYTVNFEVDDAAHTKIDPHIIVSGSK